MFISAYAFTGDSTDLVARYDQLLDTFRDDLLVHVVVVTDSGLTVWDACPDRATAEAFWHSDVFLGGLQRVGLPRPQITPVGEAHAVIANADLSV